jgi:hypothetical protein
MVRPIWTTHGEEDRQAAGSARGYRSSEERGDRSLLLQSLMLCLYLVAGRDW